MTDLAAQIRARLDVIGEGDDDCRMQCGRSCAEDGYDDVVAAVLAVIELHKPESYAVGQKLLFTCAHCRDTGWGGPDVDWPCETVLAVARPLGIELR